MNRPLFLLLCMLIPQRLYALDADTTRLEAAVLCQAMPYTCQHIPSEASIPPTRRHQPTLPRTRQVAHMGSPLAKPTAPVPAEMPTSPTQSLSLLEAAGMLACAKVVLADQAVVKMEHFAAIDRCVAVLSAMATLLCLMILCSQIACSREYFLAALEGFERGATGDLTVYTSTYRTPRHTYQSRTTCITSAQASSCSTSTR